MCVNSGFVRTLEYYTNSADYRILVKRIVFELCYCRGAFARFGWWERIKFPFLSEKGRGDRDRDR
jgi:hypothetical protein